MSRRAADDESNGEVPPKRPRHDICMISGIKKMPRRKPESETNNSPRKRRRYNLRPRKSDEGRRSGTTDEDIRDRNAVLKPSTTPSKALEVSTVNYLTKENRTAHHTDEFEQNGNILRRGQEFKVVITFDRPVTKKHDGVILQFAYGDRPLESKGSVVRIPLDFANPSSDQTNTWTARAKINESENQVTCSITPAPDCSIGFYQFFIETNLKTEKTMKRYKEEKVSTIILFNPWVVEDTVYMKNDDEREEYVLNENGRIWVGSKYSKFGRPWDFGQFDIPVLNVALKLLRDAELSDVACSSPVSVIRCMTARVNSMDDSGVLEGRWTEIYPKNCTVPWGWNGSVPILSQYYSTGRSVRFGQCWVFSGVMTTVLRCLGIPTRSVTNFESAHDTDCSMTIDKHWDVNGDPLDDMDDSVWNFHVWNESWLRRLDLPDGYDGWQAHDGTPQESSEGIMRCGPAPLAAIKEGKVFLNYDVGFIFAEVNGDKIQWEVKDDGTMEVLSIDKYSVGAYISTKSVGSDDRQDITSLYKYMDGSNDERRVVKFVNRFSTERKRNIYNLDKPKFLEFTVNHPENTLIGDDFEVAVTVKNKSDTKQSVRLRMTLVNAYYTGVSGKRVTGESFQHTIAPKSEKEFKLQVGSQDYRDKMNPEGRFQCFISGTNKDTGRMLATQTSFFLKKPTLVIEAPETVPKKKDTVCSVVFKNTTKVNLDNIVLTVEGSGLMKPVTKPIEKSVRPGESIKEEIIVHPRRRYTKKREMFASITSKQIVDIEGSVKIQIVREEEDSDDESD